MDIAYLSGRNADREKESIEGRIEEQKERYEGGGRGKEGVRREKI